MRRPSRKLTLSNENPQPSPCFAMLEVEAKGIVYDKALTQPTQSIWNCNPKNVVQLTAAQQAPNKRPLSMGSNGAGDRTEFKYLRDFDIVPVDLRAHAVVFRAVPGGVHLQPAVFVDVVVLVRGPFLLQEDELGRLGVEGLVVAFVGFSFTSTRRRPSSIMRTMTGPHRPTR